jgi:hypothetical protein
MKEYDITLQINTEPSKENIENVVKKALSMGFLCKNSQKSLSLTESLKHIRQERSIVFELDQVPFSFTIPYMDFGVVEHSRKWKRHFKSDFMPDNIRAIRLLLDLTDSFIIKRLHLDSYIKILEWPTEDNSIVVDCPLRSYHDEPKYTDGNDLAFQALKYGYIFIKSPEEQSEIEDTIIADTIDTALKLKTNLELYLKIQEFLEEEYHLVKITIIAEIRQELAITSGKLILTPQEPFKLKTSEGQTAIDRAFYIRILLNLLEDFGIHELFCTL